MIAPEFEVFQSKMPVNIAWRENNIPHMMDLIKGGAEFSVRNDENRNLLHELIVNCSPAADLLIDRRVLNDMGREDCIECLSLACHQGHRDLFFKIAALVTSITTEEANKILQSAVYGGCPIEMGFKEIIRWCINLEANPNAKVDKDGGTLFHALALEGCSDPKDHVALEILMQCGGDISMPDHEGVSPVDLVVEISPHGLTGSIFGALTDSLRLCANTSKVDEGQSARRI